MQDNQLTNLLAACRICDGGEITSLTNGFAVTSSEDSAKQCPFSIFIVPVSGTGGTMLVNGVLIGKPTTSTPAAHPVNTSEWCPQAFRSLAPNAIDLTAYRVFYGAFSPAM